MIGANPRVHSVGATIVAMRMLSAVGVVAAEDAATLQFPESDVTSVLNFYARLTGRKVWLDLEVWGRVSIQIDKPIPKTQAIELIRTTLLEKHGIEMREPNDRETFVTWSADPKYKEIIAATKKAAPSTTAPVAPGGRIRVVR